MLWENCVEAGQLYLYSVNVPLSAPNCILAITVGCSARLVVVKWVSLLISNSWVSLNVWEVTSNCSSEVLPCNTQGSVPEIFIPKSRRCTLDSPVCDLGKVSKTPRITSVNL